MARQQPSPYAWVQGVTHNLARAERCRSCHEWTVVTSDAVLDPQPLSPIGEALSLVEGHRTFAVTRYLGINRRNGAAIERHTAGQHPLPTDILRTHLCLDPVPASWTVESQLLASLTQPQPVEPPF